jgi:molecular chaperone GrpE
MIDEPNTTEVTPTESDPNLDPTTVGSNELEFSDAAQTEDISESQANQLSDLNAAELESVIAALQQENANLKQQLDQQIGQSDTIKAQYTRLAADFENFRNRTVREKEELGSKIKHDTISKLLAVIDNFERARTQLKPETEGEKAIHNSYQGVYKTFVESLKNLGVAAMRPEGELFDPEYHEAMLREETTDYPEGTVIEELRRGYLLGDKVLRHAMVKVAVEGEGVITSEQNNAEVNNLDNLNN